MARILIVDDDDAFRKALSESIRDLGYQVIEAKQAREALDQIHSADVTFLDLRMPGMTGIEFLRDARPTTPVIVLTAFADSSNTIEAIKLGAFDHLTKPVGREDLKRVLAEALKRPQISEGSRTPETADDLIGFSTSMREVQKKIGLAASGNITVLIQGETGTGKELVARAIHRHSDRATRPFVAVNCAAIPRELMESELFGHVKGAFTGAIQPRPGKFREADGGTLFLDEIGDMNLEMQAKILRVLQDKIVSPVGGQSSQQADVRIVAATHQDLPKKIQEGHFRQDLFFRLNVLSILLPPLRERGSDIVLLAEHFLRLASDPPKSLSATAAKQLLERAWPGNVRELENTMRAAALAVRGSIIDASDLQRTPTASESDCQLDELLQLDYHSAIGRLEKLLLERALSRAKGNRAEAARLLNIHRQLLYTKLKEHGLSSYSEDAG
ncbi:MAG: sigma-54-dependent Fis family transcriptional regulator [Verrucomicrobia bacterium]|nr:sigma-54-dependent Fis family transcriptional regulator [Verrucomicrobiota bacterium]